MIRTIQYAGYDIKYEAETDDSGVDLVSVAVKLTPADVNYGFVFVDEIASDELIAACTLDAEIHEQTRVKE